MANVRVTTGRPSREPGTQVGMAINTFGLAKLQGAVNSQVMAEIATEALQPAYRDCYDGWAVLTGASRDSISVDTIEVGPTFARVALQAGGEKLIADPRNKSHKDYAPYLEFNGSPSGSQPAGLIVHSIFSNDREMRQIIHDGIKRVIEGSLA